MKSTERQTSGNLTLIEAYRRPGVDGHLGQHRAKVRCQCGRVYSLSMDKWRHHPPFRCIGCSKIRNQVDFRRRAW